MKVVDHFVTITKHRHLVMKYCFKVGLYKQGLLHDLSKYSPSEFILGVIYYQGTRSPNAAEREKKGYSAAWLHHKGRNKHHYEYWLDYSPNAEVGLQGNKMPVRYVVEMFIDRMAACKTYYGDDYRNDSPLNYFLKNQGHYTMHEDTMELLEKLLTMLANEGEESTLRYIKKELLKKRKANKK